MADRFAQGVRETGYAFRRDLARGGNGSGNVPVRRAADERRDDDDGSGPAASDCRRRASGSRHGFRGDGGKVVQSDAIVLCEMLDRGLDIRERERSAGTKFSDAACLSRAKTELMSRAPRPPRASGNTGPAVRCPVAEHDATPSPPHLGARCRRRSLYAAMQSISFAFAAPGGRGDRREPLGVRVRLQCCRLPAVRNETSACPPT